MASSNLPDDVEIDADQSNPGDGSHLQTEEDLHITRLGVSFESIAASLQCLQLQTKEQKEKLHNSNEELFDKLKAALEEKDIWMIRCQRMETMLTAATAGAGDGNLANHTEDGAKQLENFLQENAFLKAECDKLREQLRRAQAGGGSVGGLNGSYGGNHSASDGVVTDAEHTEEPGATVQATQDGSTSSQHEMTYISQLSQQDSPDCAGQTEADGYPVSQQASEYQPEPSLSTRRGFQPPPLTTPHGLGFQQAGQVYPAGADRMSSSSPEDMGDKAPDDDMLQTLATHLKHTDYKVVVRTAGLTDNRIEDVEFKYDRDAQECRYQTLKEWRFRLGRRATLRVLVHTMLEKELTQTAENFCEKYGLNFLVTEYDQQHPEEPPTPATPGDGLEEYPPEPERVIKPLEQIIAPLMNNTETYEEDFLPLVEGAVFTQQQLDGFVKDQKWKDNKMFFKQELELLENILTFHNVLTCWAMTALSIYDSNPRYTEVDKRKHVWKMMKSLRKSHMEIFQKFKEEDIFQGGVVGIAPNSEKKMVNQLNFNHHNKMKLLLQQKRDDGKDWRGVASEIPNVDQRIIANWTQKGHDVATEDTLKTFGTSSKGTVQKLYEVLVGLDRGDVARVLEE